MYAKVAHRRAKRVGGPVHQSNELRLAGPAQLPRRSLEGAKADDFHDQPMKDASSSATFAGEGRRRFDVLAPPPKNAPNAAFKPCNIAMPSLAGARIVCCTIDIVSSIFRDTSSIMRSA